MHFATVMTMVDDKETLWHTWITEKSDGKSVAEKK